MLLDMWFCLTKMITRISPLCPFFTLDIEPIPPPLVEVDEGAEVSPSRGSSLVLDPSPLPPRGLAEISPARCSLLFMVDQPHATHHWVPPDFTPALMASLKNLHEHRSKDAGRLHRPMPTHALGLRTHLGRSPSRI